jgi:superfamily I DNA and RNA helicase
VLTVSTIASAKGYDAPVVFLLGVDHLRSDRKEDRALFYVGATRSKFHLVVSGVGPRQGTLLEEAVAAAEGLARGDHTSMPQQPETTTAALATTAVRM